MTRQFGTRRQGDLTVLIELATGKAVKILGTRPPGAVTDREFFANRGTLADQFDGDPEGLKAVVAGARARGYNPSASDVYLETLADDIGDPAGFVPASGGRGHIKKVCEARGDECRGMVNVKPVRFDPPPDAGPSLAEDIIQEGVADQIRHDRSLASKREQVQEAFVERHAPQP